MKIRGVSMIEFHHLNLIKTANQDIKTARKKMDIIASKYCDSDEDYNFLKIKFSELDKISESLELKIREKEEA